METEDFARDAEGSLDYSTCLLSEFCRRTWFDCFDVMETAFGLGCVRTAIAGRAGLCLPTLGGIHSDDNGRP